MPKFIAQQYELTGTSFWANSASLSLFSEVVSVLAGLSVMLTLHLLSRVSPPVRFLFPDCFFSGVREWVSTDSACLHRSTSYERIWLPVSFPLKFSESHRLSMLLHIQATRKKFSITQLFIKVTLLPPSASPKLLEGWRWQGVSQTVMQHPCMVSVSVVVHRVTASPFQLQCHVQLLSS